MKGTDDLFVLVKGLSKSEKRYFRLYAAKQQSEEDTVYLLLFDALEGMEEYDDAPLHAILREHQLGHLPQLKYYLYQTILRALNLYHARFTVESRINELLQAFTILYDKQLYAQCRKVLAKARRLTAKYDSPPHLFQILGREYQLAMIDPDRVAAEEESSRIFDELISLSESFALRHRCWSVQSKMFLLTKELGRSNDLSLTRAKGESLLHSLPPLEDGSLNDPFTTLLHLLAHVDFHAAIDRYDEACAWGRKLVEHIESVPQLRSRGARYIPVLYNYSLHLILALRLAEFPGEYAKLCAAAAEVREENPNFNDFHIRMLLPLMLLVSGEFREAAEMLGAMREEFTRMERTFRIGFTVNFNYIFAYAHFGAGDHAEALRWLNNILNDRNVATHRDLHGLTRILNLLVHYELGNLDMVASSLTSTSRFLARHGNVQSWDPVVIALIRKLLDTRDSRERNAALDTALKKLLSPGSEPMRGYWPSLDIISWIEAKRENLPFADVVRRRAERTTYSP